MVNPAIDFESNVVMREKLREYEQVFYAAGIHPNKIEMWSLEEDKEKENAIRNWAKEERTVAIGETGLDYYRIEDPVIHKREEIWFRKQIELAIEMDLPIILHIRSSDARNADEDAIKILKEYRKHKLKGVVHCFGAHPEYANEYLDMGFYLGIGGLITIEDKLRAAINEIPLDRILLETDAPFVRPIGFAGINNSSSIPVIASEIAMLKGISIEEVEKETTKNALKLFRGITCELI